MTNPGEKELKRTYVNVKVYQLGTNEKKPYYREFIALIGQLTCEPWSLMDSFFIEDALCVLD